MASLLTDTIDCPTNLLQELSARLDERRVVIEKEVLKYGEAPSGIKEVFELCRGFERAYMDLTNESSVAGKMKEAFLGEKGLVGSVRTLELEKVFELDNVKRVCRYADGYQPHLVSPEKGIRALAIEALDIIAGPVKACVQAIYALLINAAREAAERAGENTEAALMGALPMVVPDFKNIVMPAIAAAMEEWRKEAEKMSLMLVDMERSYITAGFFRHTMHKRYDKIQQAAMVGPGGPPDKQAASAKHGGGMPPPPANKNFFPAFGNKEPAPHAAAANDSEDEEPVPKKESGGGGGNNLSMNDPNDFVAAYFEKSGTDEASIMSRWQRRFFILSDSQRMLYYFKSPDDVPKPNGLRGQVNIAECLVDDLDDKGQTRGTASAPPSSTDRSHWMIRIRHKDPRQNAVKEHNSIILRAETFQAKVEWLGRLRKATGEIKTPTPQKAPKAAEGDPSVPGGSQNQPVSPPVTGGGFGADLSWTKDAETILDTHLGQGASIFRAESMREPTGRLKPAPKVLLNPVRLQDQLKNPNGVTFEAQYDALLAQCGNDLSVYTRMVSDTICITVPKALVHCMIKKSEKNLLEKLFSVIHHLTPEQMEALLKEDDAVIQRRAQARKALDDVKMAVYQVQSALERHNMTAPADRSEMVSLNAYIFAFAAMPTMLNETQVEYFNKLYSDQFSPECMRFWGQMPQSRPAPPPPKPTQPVDEEAQPPPQQQQQLPPQQRQGPPPPRPGGPPPGVGGPRGPPPPGVGGPPMMQRPPGQMMGAPPQPMMAGGPPPMRSMPSTQGGPPPVPMRPAPGAVQQGMGQPMVRRAPPPPPGAQR